MAPTFRPAIMSASLGRAWLHDFDTKVQIAAKDGFQGIEIFYEDLEYLARKDHSTDAPTPEQMLLAAEHVHQTCSAAGLTVIGLQPFLFYEGLLDRAKHDEHIEKIKLWFRIAHTLHTDIIQIPGNFLPADQLSGDFDVIAADLRELADLGLQQQPVVRFAYENLCWSTHVDTWDKAWDVCRRVDRPNFGLCLDTFNIAGRVWADPASATGRTGPDADAERVVPPLGPSHPWHVDSQPARMSWSRNARTFLYEEDRGAYLPVESVARAIIEELGYKGWVSMELFSRTMAEEGAHVPAEHSRRGIAAWEKFEKRLKLNQ
jgi:4-hydroxyphenylpyruvate dioxygenase